MSISPIQGHPVTSQDLSFRPIKTSKCSLLPPSSDSEELSGNESEREVPKANHTSSIKKDFLHPSAKKNIKKLPRSLSSKINYKRPSFLPRTDFYSSSLDIRLSHLSPRLLTLINEKILKIKPSIIRLENLTYFFEMIKAKN